MKYIRQLNEKRYYLRISVIDRCNLWDVFTVCRRGIESIPPW